MSMQIISFITFLSLLVVDLASLKVWQLSTKYISEYSAANIMSLHIFLYLLVTCCSYMSKTLDTCPRVQKHLPATSKQDSKYTRFGCSNKDMDCELDCLFAIYTLKVRSVLANL